MRKYAGQTYSYDGTGQRVMKAAGSVTTVYVHDVFGNLAAQYTTGALPTQPCTTCYLSWDHLGSTRMVTGAAGAVVARHDYLPFGVEISGGSAGRTSLWGTTDNVAQKFTGQERDGETGFDFFQARYLPSVQARFNSADPGNIGSDPRDPQSWNAYTYTGNNPLSRTDPDGRDYSVCSNDENGAQQCTYVANDQAFEQSLQNPGSGIYRKRRQRKRNDISTTPGARCVEVRRAASRIQVCATASILER